jgi:Protein of unknown function (DUF4232)
MAGFRRAGRSSPRLALLAVVVGGGIVLAACSSGGTSASSTSTTHRSATTLPATTTSAPVTTTSPHGSTTTTDANTAAVPTCLASQLSIEPHQGGGAAGTISLTISMRNTSATACTLQGYPGMQLLNSQGATIPTNVVRGSFTGSAPAAASQPPALVTLAPGFSATFWLQYEDVPVGNETTCPASKQAQITPPNDTAPALVSLDISPCNNGTVHVSPIYAAG